MLKNLRIGDFVITPVGKKKRVLDVIKRPGRQPQFLLSLTGDYSVIDGDGKTRWTIKEMEAKGFKVEVNMAEQIKGLSKGKKEFFCVCLDGDKSFLLGREISRSKIVEVLTKHLMELI